ncbi:MAG: hypothetical protein MJ166_01015 [Clostridia bacterium]|nr:hypothetical protein [Clostridia bacterium]
MGSSIETSICFALVILILTMFVVFPVDIWKECLDIGKNNIEELSFHMDNEYPVNLKEINDHYSTDTSPELINTAITGIIDAIHIAVR